MNSKVLKYCLLLIFFNWEVLSAQSNLRHITEYTYTIKCSGKIYKRQFLSDSVFVEKYFSQVNKASLDSEFVPTDTFKVINGNWWYSLGGKYYPFFSLSMFESKEITTRYYNFKDGKFYDCIGYLPYKKEKINNKDIYVFKVNYNGCGKENFNQIDIAYFYFDPDIGFIKENIWTCGMSEIIILKEGK
jgi:hypothetical protein